MGRQWREGRGDDRRVRLHRPAGVPTDAASLRAAVREGEAVGMSRRDAILDVAQRAGLPKREVYNAVHQDVDEAEDA